MKPEEIIQSLKLIPHPEERGYFIETYRSPFSTAIYFLVTSEGMSQLHRLTSDEIFHFYCGAAAEVLLLDPNKSNGQIIRLGSDVVSGEIPQLLIPKGVWQGMRTTGDFTLIGCTVAPPFQYDQYEAGKRDELIRQFPAHQETIRRLTLLTSD